MLLSGYHSAIERGLIEMSALCHSLIKLPSAMSLQDFSHMLSLQNIPLCNKAQLIFMKFSVVEWNFLANLLLLIFTTFTLKFTTKNTQKNH